MHKKLMYWYWSANNACKSLGLEQASETVEDEAPVRIVTRS